eukprot:scaffold10157_cov162-Amphora_coffeaeformis.AAC.5
MVAPITFGTQTTRGSSVPPPAVLIHPPTLQRGTSGPTDESATRTPNAQQQKQTASDATNSDM